MAGEMPGQAEAQSKQLATTDSKSGRRLSRQAKGEALNSRVDVHQSVPETTLSAVAASGPYISLSWVISDPPPIPYKAITKGIPGLS